MRISTGLNCSQFPYLSKEEKINSKTKVPEVEVTGIQLRPADGFPSDIHLIQEANKAILRLSHQARMINLAMDEDLPQENEGIAPTNLTEKNPFALSDLTTIADVRIGEPQLPLLHTNLEEMAAALLERMNEVLRVNSGSSNAGIAPDDVAQEDKNSLEQIREIIVSALRIPETMNEAFRDLPSLGIKLMHDGLLSVERQSLKEAIFSNGGEVARAVKTVALNLFETLPLCIDPSSGTLIYTGERLEDGGDDKASKVLAAFGEELDKERTELEKRLSVAELLILYSNNLIADLKPQSEALIAEE
jgi:hypothetical protein